MLFLYDYNLTLDLQQRLKVFEREEGEARLA